MGLTKINSGTVSTRPRPAHPRATAQVGCASRHPGTALVAALLNLRSSEHIKGDDALSRAIACDPTIPGAAGPGGRMLLHVTWIG